MAENITLSDDLRRLLQAEEDAGAISAGRLRSRSEDLIDALRIRHEEQGHLPSPAPARSEPLRKVG
ncbi:MAG: hypothetical protein V4555_07255 [Acidobacteriota bacterium]